MQKPVSFEDIAKRVLDSLPAGLQELESDVRRNLRAGLAQVLRDMDLVTREEYDVQRRMLERTREKLEQLQCTAAGLEARLNALEDDSGTDAPPS